MKCYLNSIWSHSGKKRGKVCGQTFNENLIVVSRWSSSDLLRQSFLKLYVVTSDVSVYKISSQYFSEMLLIQWHSAYQPNSNFVTYFLLACMITCCFTFCPQRYLMSDSDEHRQLFELIERMLEYDPSQRITMREALAHQYFDKLSAQQRGHSNAHSDRDRSHSISR